MIELQPMKSRMVWFQVFFGTKSGPGVNAIVRHNRTQGMVPIISHQIDSSGDPVVLRMFNETKLRRPSFPGEMQHLFHNHKWLDKNAANGFSSETKFVNVTNIGLSFPFLHETLRFLEGYRTF
jgi:hypothetical protein